MEYTLVSLSLPPITPALSGRSFVSLPVLPRLGRAWAWRVQRRFLCLWPSLRGRLDDRVGVAKSVPQGRHAIDHSRLQSRAYMHMYACTHAGIQYRTECTRGVITSQCVDEQPPRCYTYISAAYASVQGEGVLCTAHALYRPYSCAD